MFGFSHAETTSWSNPVTIAALALSAVLLPSFLALERRAAQPAAAASDRVDRARGGAYASIALAGSAVFPVFLFLTYYMSRTSASRR